MNKSDSSLHKCNCRLTVCLIILFSFLFLLLLFPLLMIPLLLDPLLIPLLLAPLLGFLFFLFLGSSSSSSWVPLLGFLFLGSSSWVPLLGFLFLGSSSGFPLLNPLLSFLLVHRLPHYKTEKHSAANILITDNNKNIYLFFDSELLVCVCISSPSFLLLLFLVPLLPHLKRDKGTNVYDLKRRYGGNRTETFIAIRERIMTSCL